ncbi:MAG: hypothetical protein ACJ70O_03170 [Nitrososphaera sp.]
MRSYYDTDVQTAAARIRKNDNYNGPENKGFRWMIDFEKEDMDTVQHFLNLGIKMRQAGNIIPMTFAVTDNEFIELMQEVKIHG